MWALTAMVVASSAIWAMALMVVASMKYGSKK
jgi:hypothetical protein